ncbi:ATP synthase gamma chain [Alcanivorax sp. ALC70]|nr:ATP synthase gamma chain [Alcanivorax sp. ALC70]
MASGKEIKGKIASVQSTKKITRAMEMVAASKMRKAQERMEASKPYATRMRQVVAHLANADLEYRHIYLQERDVKNVGYIVVTSDRGLAGGLNVNLLKSVVKDAREWEEKGAKVQHCVVGSKGLAFFRSVGGNVEASVNGLGDAPHLSDLIGSIKVMLDAYENGEIDRLYIVYNEFVNTMTQKPKTIRLLPWNRARTRSSSVTGTTSTSRRRRSCSTSCWCGSSSPRSIRAWLRTMPANRPRGWWR